MKAQMTTFHSPELDFSLSGMLYQGKPVFVAVDVAIALGYERPFDAVSTHCKSLIKLKHGEMASLGLEPKPNGISLIGEPDLYRLILRSQLPKAERVQDWVCEEVLPSIRATGSYSMTVTSTNAPNFDDPIAVAEAWIEAKKAERLAIGYVDRQARYISKLQNHISDGISPCQFCKQLNGVNVQQVNAFLAEHNWLRDDRPDAKRPRWRVKAYARDQYLTEQSGRVEQTDGEMRETFKPILLHKGAVWIYRQYLNGELPMKATWNGEFTHIKELETSHKQQCRSEK